MRFPFPKTPIPASSLAGGCSGSGVPLLLRAAFASQPECILWLSLLFPPVGSNLDSNVTRSTYQTDHDDRDFDPRFTSREFLLENAITDKLLDKTSDSKELVLNMTMNSIFAQADPINSVGSHIDSLYVDYEDTDGVVTYTINSTYMELSKAINTSAETPFSNATITMTSPQGNRTHKAR